MSNLELIEMELEWQELVDEMDLVKKLGPQGFEFSHKMFNKAYSRGYMKPHLIKSEHITNTKLNYADTNVSL